MPNFVPATLLEEDGNVSSYDSRAERPKIILRLYGFDFENKEDESINESNAKGK